MQLWCKSGELSTCAVLLNPTQLTCVFRLIVFVWIFLHVAATRSGKCPLVDLSLPVDWHTDVHESGGPSLAADMAVYGLCRQKLKGGNEHRSWSLKVTVSPKSMLLRETKLRSSSHLKLPSKMPSTEPLVSLAHFINGTVLQYRQLRYRQPGPDCQRQQRFCKGLS